MNHLSHLHIDGFRSIKSADIALRPLNVMIGASGAGKSNLIDFFRMLNHMVTPPLSHPPPGESAIIGTDSPTSCTVRMSKPVIRPRSDSPDFQKQRAVHSTGEGADSWTFDR